MLGSEPTSLRENAIFERKLAALGRKSMMMKGVIDAPVVERAKLRLAREAVIAGREAGSSQLILLKMDHPPDRGNYSWRDDACDHTRSSASKIALILSISWHFSHWSNSSAFVSARTS